MTYKDGKWPADHNIGVTPQITVYSRAPFVWHKKFVLFPRKLEDGGYGIGNLYAKYNGLGWRYRRELP